MEEKRRSPLLAALLSALLAGLGDAYNGFPRKGARLLVFDSPPSARRTQRERGLRRRLGRKP